MTDDGCDPCGDGLKADGASATTAAKKLSVGIAPGLTTSD
jgi:hypothetical protein